MNIFKKIFSQSKQEQIRMKASDIKEKIETEIVEYVVYVLDDRYNLLNPKDHLEISMVMNHHLQLVSEIDIAKIDAQVGNFYMFEEQWICLNKRNQSFWKRVVINLV
jgi:hypothetical protein